MGQPWFKNGMPLFAGGSPVLCDTCPCPPKCDSVYCPATDSTIVPMQVVIEVTVPDTLWIYGGRSIDPGTGEPEPFYRKYKWEGLSAFNGTYTINRSPWPSCAWEVPYRTIPVTRTIYSGVVGADGCPDDSTLVIEDGPTYLDPGWSSNIYYYGSPANFTGITFGLGGVVHYMSFTPDDANFLGYANDPCVPQSLTGRAGGWSGCVDPTTSTGTVTVYE